MMLFINNHIGWFSILSIIMTIVIALIVGWSDIKEFERKVQKQ